MTGPSLFDDSENLSSGGRSDPKLGTPADSNDRADSVRRSALWSAYGDALGWISELLTNEKGLKRRTSGAPLDKPIEWKRRIGGRSGVTVTLPKGCYSDDSQLRLATARSIRPDGFDVEAFSKVELPVWLSYKLGGGKSTSAAATNLARPRVAWFANTFRGWIDSGGNGAAMRIQPHVWAARSPDDPATFLPDVIRNAICTHSHPDGLMGAVFHALALARAMVTGFPPSPDDLLDATDKVSDFFTVVQDDVEVAQYWRAEFERKSGAFDDAWARAVDDCKKSIQFAAETSKKTGVERYTAIVDGLMLRDPARRGNGMLTAVAAMGLTWSESQPEAAMSIAANAIGTDTDTIATMAGAILGINAKADPPVEVMDAELFRSEADRLSEIANGKKPKGHRYPDLLRWSAPQTHADALVRSDRGGLSVRGLGTAELKGEPIPSQDNSFVWQWLKLEAGQTLLVKRRNELAVEGGKIGDRVSKQPSARLPLDIGGSNRVRSDGHTNEGVHPRGRMLAHPLSKDQFRRSDSKPDLDAMVKYLEKNKDDDKIVGQVIRRVVNKCTPGQIGAFLAVLIDYLSEPQIRPPRQRS